jgi:hypothetical protein
MRVESLNERVTISVQGISDVGAIRLYGLQLPSRLQMRRCRPRQARVVVEIAESNIAFVAKKAADLAGRVTMIDAKRHAGPPANGARVFLPCQDGFELLQGKPVGTGTPLDPIVGIGQRFVPVPSSHTRVDFRPVPGQVRALLRTPLLSIFRVSCISLLVPSLVRTHRSVGPSIPPVRIIEHRKRAPPRCAREALRQRQWAMGVMPVRLRAVSNDTQLRSEATPAINADL